MAQGLQLFRQDDFTGGLNLRADQFQLGANESPDMLNVEIDPRGGIASRGGMSKIVTNGIISGTTTFVASSSSWNPKKCAPMLSSSNISFASPVWTTLPPAKM